MRYKKASDAFEKMAAPEVAGRKSIGMENSVGEFFYISLDNLIPFKNQAREIFDQQELELLADSIRSYGIRQPLSVVKSLEEEGKFEIISGERRAKAAQIAGLKSVPCIILEDYKEAEAVAVIENIHRSDLHPVELAKAYKSLLDGGTFVSAYGLWKALGVSQSAGYETLKILELPEKVQKFLLDNNIRGRDAIRSILRSKDPIKAIQPAEYAEREEKKQKTVLRIVLKDREFVSQNQPIEKLTDSEKQKLKVLLEEIIKKLEHDMPYRITDL